MDKCLCIKFIKKVTVFIGCLLICCIFSTGCVSENQNIESADINATFEEDYILLKQVTDYLQFVSDVNDIDSIWIKSDNSSVMTVHYIHSEHYGDKLYIHDKEFKNTVQALFKRGYYYIDFEKPDETTIAFKRFKKPFDEEYNSGFAYTTSVKGELDTILYLVSQKELSISNWYFYEEDFNEWRVKDTQNN